LEDEPRRSVAAEDNIREPYDKRATILAPPMRRESPFLTDLGADAKVHTLFIRVSAASESYTTNTFGFKNI
jgi:hypothetical protein